jgi:hypothetical protein
VLEALEKENEALEARISAGAAAALEDQTARNEQEAATTALAPEKEARPGRCVAGGGALVSRNSLKTQRVSSRGPCSIL